MVRATDERMARAAAVAAAGSSLATAADAAGVSERTVQRWAKDPRWAPLYDRARAAAATEAGAEAVLVLRSLLRSGDEAVRASAARVLATVQSAKDRVAARQAAAADDPLADLGGEVTAEEVRDAVLAARVLRDRARAGWERTGAAASERIARLIETDPAEARRLLTAWHQELCRDR
ncbi:MAG: hypothetical protein C0501_03785 [Isosphaera sp.]|nr:hypothetical protein [Isosphaera sp.]